jgi:hypothetical protein
MLQDTVRDPKNANEDVDVSVLNRDTVWTYDRGQQTVGSAPLGALLVHCGGGGGPSFDMWETLILNEIWAQDKIYNLAGTLIR